MKSTFLHVILIFCVAMATCAIFCFYLYPRYADALTAPLDIDGHGRLGIGLYESGTLGVEPQFEASVNRGPIYPAFIAAMLSISKGWYPYSIQIGHCILFALASLSAYFLARLLYPDRINMAFWIGIFCAIHPYIILFTSRMYVETIATLLFTFIAVLVIYFSLRPAFWKAFLIGVTLGIAALTKTTFLVFLFVIPLYFYFVIKSRLSQCLIILVTGCAIIAPWTYRNWVVTGKFIPVQLLIGYNFKVGDEKVDDFYKYELKDFWHSNQKFEWPDIPLTESTVAKSEVKADEAYLQESLQRYKADPSFFFKKILYNAWAFWIMGTSFVKTCLIALLQLPLLFFFILGCISISKRDHGKLYALPILMVLIYYLEHLPVLSGARFSVVLIPTMLTYCFASKYLYRVKV